MGELNDELSKLSLSRRIIWIRMLFKWKNSLWQSLWADFIWFIIAYILVTVLYQFVIVLYPVHRDNYKAFAVYVNKLSKIISLSFLVGFFVSTVMARWKTIVWSMPWLSKAAFATQICINRRSDDRKKAKLETVARRKISSAGYDECDSTPKLSLDEENLLVENIRLNMLRYLNMSWIFTMIGLSKTIRERFQVDNTTALDKHGSRVPVRARCNLINNEAAVKKAYPNCLILEEEIKVFERFEAELPPNQSYLLNYWIPLQWSTRVLLRAFNEGYLFNFKFYLFMNKIIDEFRGALGTMAMYSMVNIPLVYIQLVIFAVYTFVFAEIFQQPDNLLRRGMRRGPVKVMITPLNNTMSASVTRAGVSLEDAFNFSTFVPMLSIIKFLFYMGWFKIGLRLLFPFQEDNVYMPLNDVLDYNLHIGTQGCKTRDEIYPEFLTMKVGSEHAQLQTLIAQSKLQLLESQPPDRQHPSQNEDEEETEIMIKSGGDELKMRNLSPV